LILAMTLATLAGCDRDSPARTNTPPAPAPLLGSAAPAPPANVVQTEMRMLTSIVEATVRAIGTRDVRAIDQQLHRLHAAKETTTAALRDGSYKLPKSTDQVDAFIAMDEAFHEHLGALVLASRANNVQGAADALGAIVQGCEGCHAVFRAPNAPTQ
jgi:cytochrome c556